MVIITDPLCTEYRMEGHPERPERVSETVRFLKAQKSIPIDWQKPSEVEESQLLRAHSKEHLLKLQKYDHFFDADTPSYPDIFDHAKRSVGGALRALDAVIAGKRAMSLLRPPGHHATSNQVMGFCYLNQVAIASFEAQKKGFSKVAVFDFDVHHGNGTEAILLNRSGFSFYSIHQYPCYPGTGSKSIDNCFNYPVAPNTARLEYRKVIQKALDDLAGWKPDLIAVSAGFDAYRDDPLSEETLEPEDFQWIGKSLRDLSVPFFSCLEGGYSDELPSLIMAYLAGVEGL